MRCWELEMRFQKGCKECCRKMVSGRKVEGAIKSLVNARGLQLE